MNLNEIGAGNDIPGAEFLPDGLKELVSRSLRLHDRISVMDGMIAGKATPEAANENPVADQWNQLAKAFGQG